MKKALTFILGTLIVSIPLILNQAHANQTTTGPCRQNEDCNVNEICINGTCQVTTLKEIQFDIGKNLSLEDQELSQQENPIVALILKVINFAITIIGSIAIIILIIGGFMMMFSQGNQQKLDEAKDVIKYAFIGLSITFLSYIIVISVQSLFIAKT
jgi:hypothetical protein